MLLAILFGCAKQTIIVSNGPYDAVPIKKTSHFVFQGIAQEDMLDANKICPNGIGKVSTLYAPKDIAIVAGLSFTVIGPFIYTPKTWEIYCSK